MQKSLTDLSDDDVKEIISFSELFFTPREVAVILEFNEEEVLDDMEVKGAFYRAFQQGRLTSESELRKSIVKLAKSGSSPAQTMALEMLNKSKVKMLDR